MFLNAKIHFLFQWTQKVVLKSVENHKKSSLKVYFDKVYQTYNRMFFHNQSTFTTSPLTLPYRKKYNFYSIQRLYWIFLLPLRCRKGRADRLLTTYRWRVVKSEQKLFTTPNALFIGIYKGKVKSEEFLALRRNKKYKE